MCTMPAWGWVVAARLRAVFFRLVAAERLLVELFALRPERDFAVALRDGAALFAVRFLAADGFFVGERFTADFLRAGFRALVFLRAVLLRAAMTCVFLLHITRTCITMGGDL